MSQGIFEIDGKNWTIVLKHEVRCTYSD